jgi:protein translocase SecG subunit
MYNQFYMNFKQRSTQMSTIELISAILLILSCIFIIIIVFFQGGSKPGMSQTITGQSGDNYYQKNQGRSKEMKLKKMTVAAAVVFFTVAIAVNVIAVHFPDLGTRNNNQSPIENINPSAPTAPTVPTVPTAPTAPTPPTEVD